MAIGHRPQGGSPVSRVQLIAGHAAEPRAVVPPPAVAPARPRSGFYARYGKRALDLALGTMLFLLLLPVIIAVAVLVLATCGRPVLYASDRMGRGGRPFRMWKFRTMTADADQQRAAWQETHPQLATEIASNWKVSGDPRVTRIGRMLRRTSLDELPQFWNVLRGEMSLVGPRPYLTTETLDPTARDAILSVLPGLTGPFQVRGRHGIAPLSRMQLEAAYAAESGLMADLRYIARTAGPLLKMDGQ